MDTVFLWLHCIAEFLHFLNPVMMCIATAVWIKLYSSTAKERIKIYSRCYILERQIDLLLTHYAIDQRDIQHIDILRKMHE